MEPSLLVERVDDGQGLAVDWLHDLIYWTNPRRGRIEVSDLKGQMRHPVLASDLENPRDLVLDPRVRWMWWGDWGSKPRIERAGLDGHPRQAIATQDVHWPNGLTLDLATKRIFWADAKLHIISSANYDGGHRSTLHIPATTLMHPFGLTLWEDSVYWSDWRARALLSAHKHHPARQNITTFITNLPSPMGLTVVHQQRQPTDSDAVCGGDAGHHCDGLCLPTPINDVRQRGYSCACGDDKQLGEDGSSCVGLPPLYPSLSPPHEVATPPDYVSQPMEPGSGHLAGIIIGVLGALLIVITVVVYFVYRQMSRKRSKNLNFDNPVYRKTTEEQVQIEGGEAHNGHVPPSLQPLTTTTDYENV